MEISTYSTKKNYLSSKKYRKFKIETNKSSYHQLSPMTYTAIHFSIMSSLAIPIYCVTQTEKNIYL